jgi:hypothetical protein
MLGRGKRRFCKTPMLGRKKDGDSIKGRETHTPLGCNKEERESDG